MRRGSDSDMFCGDHLDIERMFCTERFEFEPPLSTGNHVSSPLADATVRNAVIFTDSESNRDVEAVSSVNAVKRKLHSTIWEWE